MDYRQLGRSGLRVSPLCLGAMTFGESASFMKGVTASDTEARAILDRALERGVNLVDTANIYSEGRSEELLGQWLPSRRNSVVLATKCRFAVGQGPMDYGLSRRHIVMACEDSLRRLRTDFIDLYQVHMQDGSTPIEETLGALDDLRRAGKVRYTGCSNYTGYRLTEALWTADRRNLASYASVQLQWSLVERGAEREVIPACRAFGLGVLVWSPLGRGFLSGKYSQGAAPPAGTRLAEWKDTYKKYDHPLTWKAVEAVKKAAQELSTTPSRVALAWLLGRTEVSSVIVGARTLAQLDDNLGAAELTLPAELHQALEQASEPAWAYPYDFIGQRERW